VANRIVAFFNYDSPVCSRDIRGALQMSLASADSVLISEQHDISLLRFRDDPPREFQPYFLGWNVSASPAAPFHGIHHPNGGVKKVTVSENSLLAGSWSANWAAPNVHWIVRYNVASTEGGSSGSPLLDRNGRIVGTLTGGDSFCNPVRGRDWFAALSRFMDVQGSLNNPNSLRHYLDPLNTNIPQLGGFNPFANAPITRRHNFNTNDIIVQTEHNSVPMFATNNTLGYSAFAEEFYAAESAEIRGVFVASAPTTNASNLDLRIRVYTGENRPEHLVREQSFNFSFRRLSSGNFQNIPRNMDRYVENFIQFGTPISVSGRFFISISDANNVPSGFSVLNVEPRPAGSGITTSAWLRSSEGWHRSSESIHNPINTSLMITPFVVGSVEPPPPNGEELDMTIRFSRAEQMVFIESNQELAHWEMFYSDGRQVFRAQAGAGSSVNRTSIPAAHLARGVYIVRARTIKGRSYVRKILVI